MRLMGCDDEDEDDIGNQNTMLCIILIIYIF